MRRALAATGTADLECRHFDTLSGGEKQRVVIASALAQFEEDSRDAESRLLILDEPTAALDLHYQIEVAQLLRRLADERGLTLLVTTHDLQFAWQVCDRVVLLQEGRVLADGPTEETLTPEHLHTLYGVRVDRMTHPDGTVSLVPTSLVGDRSRRTAAPVADPARSAAVTTPAGSGAVQARRVGSARSTSRRAGRLGAPAPGLAHLRRLRCPAAGRHRRRSARRIHARSTCARCWIDRVPLPRTSTPRSSSSPACRACSPRGWSAPRSRWPAS